MKKDKTLTCKKEEAEEKSPICRVCCYRCNESAKGFSLFEKYKDAYIYEKINYIACIDIIEGDDLPEMICSSCLLALENACSFKQKCESSDAILRSALRLGVPCHEQLIQVPIKDEIETHSDYDYLDEDAPSPSVLLKVDDVTCQETGKDINFKSRVIDLKLECHDCGGSFKSKCKLQVHWKKVHQPKQLICPICKKVLKTFKSLHSHMKKKAKMCINAAKFKIEGEGRSRVFYCKECDAHSNRLQSMVAHSYIHTGERPFSCNICNKTFTQHGSMSAHKESAHQIYAKEGTCHQCGKHFKGRSKLYRHMKTHNDAQLSCKICNKLFKSKVYLKYHMKRHSGVKGFTCEICAKRFYTSSDLCNHKATTHKQKERRAYACDLCQYKTKNSSRLSQHRMKHSDDNVACEVCGSFVHNLHQLELHKKRHFEKNFQCIYCNKLYYGRKNLSAHVRKKHNVSLSRIEDLNTSGIGRIDSDTAGISRVDSNESEINRIVTVHRIKVKNDQPAPITEVS